MYATISNFLVDPRTISKKKEKEKKASGQHHGSNEMYYSRQSDKNRIIFKCPSNHSLLKMETGKKQTFVCDGCNGRQMSHSTMYGCNICNYHLCLTCLNSICYKYPINSKSFNNKSQFYPPLNNINSNLLNIKDNYYNHNPPDSTNAINAANAASAANSMNAANDKTRESYTINRGNDDVAAIENGQMPYMDILYSLLYLLVTLVFYALFQWIIVAIICSLLLVGLIYKYQQNKTNSTKLF